MRWRNGTAGRAMGLVLVLTGCEAASAAEAAPLATVVVMPGPAAGAPKGSRAKLNATCVGCHEEAAQTWSDSMHQRSWADEDFQVAREPRPFCRSCHAPESDPARRPTAAAADLGVACVTCHVPAAASLPDGAVLAVPGGDAAAPSPHPVVRSASFASSDACASCHEFASPRQPNLPLQSTISEHQRSAHASKSCQSCHMPKSATGRGHAFSASRDPIMLRSAVDVTATRTSADSIDLQVRPRHVGHAFPTGDPFRRLSLEVDVVEGEGWVAVESRALQRVIEPGHGVSTRRVEVEDTRVGGADDVRVHTFDLGGHERSAVRWRLVYERLDHPFGADEPLVFGRVHLFEGVLDPPSSP